MSQIRLFSAAGDPLATATSDAAGQFHFRDLPSSEGYTLEARADHYRTGLRALDRIDPAHAEPVRVELEPGEAGPFRVALARSDGSAPGGASVTLLTEAGAALRSLSADSRGTIELEGVPEGRYLVVWSDPVAGTGASERLIEAPGPVHEVLPRGVDVELSCGDPSACGGAAVEGLGIYGPTGHEIGAFLPALSTAMRFSRDGLLPLGRLTPGRYLVRAVIGGQRLDRWIDVGGSRMVVALAGSGP